MNRICVGILAHVDAGKTTMAEAMLYKSGKIRHPGRVDHKDAYLDTDSIEKERGITIFSKQAVFDTEQFRINLLDTPGHMDFSAEMERTLSVLDCAILVISGVDGVQAHTETLWRLLRRHHLPVFVWVNKMDRCEKTHEEIIRDLTEHFGSGFADFNRPDHEELAMSEEAALDEYMENGMLSEGTIRILIERRKIYPCLFGSALKFEGVEEFLSCLDRYLPRKEWGSLFGAKVFKITHDDNGQRLSWLKMTGGELKLRGTVGEDKITQIRIYSGVKFDAVDTALAGDVAAVCGLDKSYAGQGLGTESDAPKPVLEPVLSYRIVPPEGVDCRELLQKLKPLEEEDPMLRIVWNSELREISIQIMGEIQIQVLKELVSERFGVDITIEQGKILYKETIAAPVVGVGHFEPLRHYAEVHLLLEPLPPGSGVVFESACSTDDLSLNWQRLVVGNLYQKKHRGVLTGSPITDIKATLIAGRAHLKHTEGGDFRQASYRALRQGLMKAENVLLEPYYDYILEVPSEHVGRAMTDLKAMYARMDSPRTLEKTTVITGRGPVSTMQGYLNDVLAYTKGLGHISCSFGAYYPCHNTEEVIESIAYDPEADMWNSPDSVFCSHGAGVNVKWDVVEEFMHLDDGVSFGEDDAPVLKQPKLRSGSIDFDEKELEAIMEREFGPIKRPKYARVSYDSDEAKKKEEKKRIKKDYLIADGYNIIYAWDNLSDLAREDMPAAVSRLINILANYRAYEDVELVLVFDGYKVKGNPGTKELESGLKIVYTKEGESADFYIEKLVAEVKNNYNVKVVSSDGMIQLAALRGGILRMSSAEFKILVDKAMEEIAQILEDENRNASFRNKIKLQN